MCIVADDVKDVSKTKIVSFHVGYVEGRPGPQYELGSSTEIKPIPAQLIVYSAQVDTVVNSNAFILPVYNPGNDTSKIVPLDFSKLSTFITDIETIFDRWYPKPRSWSNGTFSANSSLSYDAEPLPVYQVGDYKFSLMPSRMEFNRIDKTQLNINPTAKVAIDVHSNDYSFIVYQFFQKGKLEVTPFGYLCPSYPHVDNSMIIPTVHGHPHDMFTSNTGMGYIPNMYVGFKSDFEDKASFDHEIYTLIKTTEPTKFSTKTNIVDIDRLLRQIQTDYLNRQLRIYVPNNFVPKKIKISGTNPNRNLFVTSDGYQYVKDLTIDGTSGSQTASWNVTPFSQANGPVTFTV